MKATIFAIIVTFAAAGVVPSEAEARTRNRSYTKANKQRQPARRVRRPVRHVRKPVRRHVRKPARRHVRKPVRHYRKPARRHVRKPARHYRKPVRRHYRKPVRHYRQPVRRHYRPVYVSPLKTVTVTNDHGYGIYVELRTGNSSICAANPSQGTVFLTAGSATSVSTRAAYVCYRRVGTRYTAGSVWFRSVIGVRHLSLLF